MTAAYITDSEMVMLTDGLGSASPSEINRVVSSADAIDRRALLLGKDGGSYGGASCPI